MQLGIKILYGTFVGLILIIAPIGNACLVYAIISTKKHRAIVSNIYLVTLAITDFLGGVINAPYFLISLNLPDYDVSLKEKYSVPCKAGNFFVYAIGINRILALMLMSVDRYVAILHPFVYQRLVNRRMAIVLSLFITLQSCVTNLPMSLIPGWVNYDGKPGAPCGFLWDGKLSFLTPYVLLNFCVPLIVLLVTNTKVFVIARAQRRKILSLHSGRPKGKKKWTFGMLGSVANFNLTANESPNDKECNVIQNGGCLTEARNQNLYDMSRKNSDYLSDSGKQTSASNPRCNEPSFNAEKSCKEVLHNLVEQRDSVNGDLKLEKNLQFDEKEDSVSMKPMTCSFSVQSFIPASAESSSDSRDVSTERTISPAVTVYVNAIVETLHVENHGEVRTRGDQSEIDKVIKVNQREEFVIDASNESKKNDTQKIQTQDIIITFSTIVIVVLFLISWSPFVFARVAFVADRRLFSWHAVVWTTALTLAGSAGNPLIVLGTRRDLRETIFKRFKIGQKDKPNAGNYQESGKSNE